MRSSSPPTLTATLPHPTSGGATQSLLVGLPVPDRATTTTEWLGTVAGSRPAREAPSAETPETVRVEPGDTLWGLAGASLAADATTERSTAGGGRSTARTATTIGADPDLIRPGQRLVLPPSGTDRR